MILEQISEVKSILEGYRFDSSSEKRFQDGVQEVLSRAGLEFEREARLSSFDVIDFLLAGGLGIECKIGGSLSAVAEQLIRYAKNPKITALILFTGRVHLRSLPAVVMGKPLFVVTTWRSGF